MPKLENPTPAPIAGSSSPTAGKFKKGAPWLILALVIVGAGIFASQQYTKANNLNKQLADLKNNPNKITEDQTKELIGKIGQLIVLPTGEQPTVATVTDLKPLADQPFFANAKVGYKVLIYTTAKKAILYDPGANKIVEVAPVNIGNTAGTQPQVAGDATTKKAPVAPKNSANTNSNTP